MQNQLAEKGTLEEIMKKEKEQDIIDYNVMDFSEDDDLDEVTVEKEQVKKSADMKTSQRKVSKNKSKKKKEDMTFKERFLAFIDSLSLQEVAIGGFSVAIAVVAVVTLVVIFKTTAINNENERLAQQDTVVDSGANDIADDVEEDSGAEEAVAEVVSPVEIPEMSEYTIKSQSTVKDLTLIFQDSNKKKIKGTEFAVKLVDEKSAKKLDSSISALKEDRETLSSLKSKQDEIASQMTSAKASTVVSDLKTAKAADKTSGSSDSSKGSGSSSSDSLSDQMNEINEEVTKAISKRDEDIKAYNKVLDGLKGNSYKDEDKDGMIYIKSIDSGNYVACAESASNYVATSYATKVSVKEKADYKPIADIKEKVVSDKAAGDTKEEKPAVEKALTDTVEYVDSKKNGDGGYEETTDIKLPVPSASKELNSKTEKDLSANAVKTTLSLNPTSLDITAGESKAIAATVTPAGTAITWSSSDAGVATVNNGTVTGVKAGSATITAKAGDVSATCAVTVKDEVQEVKVTSIIISGAPPSLEVRNTANLSATVTYSNGTTDSSVTWSSSDVDVATVSNGTVTAVAPGDVTIKAVSTKQTDMSAQVKINVTAKASEPATQPETNTQTQTESNAKPQDSSFNFDIHSTRQYLISRLGGKTYKVDAKKAAANAATSGTSSAAAGALDCTLSIPKTATLYSSDSEKLNTLSMGITATNMTGLKAAGDANVSAAVSADGKAVTIKTKNGINKDTNATVTLSGTTTGTGKKAISVTCTVTVKSSDTKILASDGSDLYIDTNGTVLTVGNYSGQKIYKHGGDFQYTGWQTINNATYYYDKNGNKVTGEQVIQGAKYNFGSDGSLLKSGNGIDVSKWQGNINWNQAAGAISFAVIRCGYRGTSGNMAQDPKYLQNIKGAKAAGVRVGIYFYSRATNEAEAIEEASLAVSLAKQGGGVSLPIYMDMEASNQKGLSADQLTAIANAFIATVNNGGYRGGLYASKNWLSRRMNNGAGVSGSIWVAQYNTKCTYGGRKDLWQYTSSGTCPGISGKVDWNESYF